MCNSRCYPVILAAVLAAAATSGRVQAVDIEDRGAPTAIPGTVSGTPLVGGPFSLEARNVSVGNASVGGPYRLAGFPGLKADSEVFSDGFESGDTFGWSTEVPEVQFPRGAIVAFELEECPAGWVYAGNEFRGRTLVGLAPGGNLSAGTGSGWTGTHDAHYHYPDITVVTDSKNHNHHWGTLVNASVKTWQTLSATNQTVNIIQWTDGIGAEGTGIYPLATSPGDWLYTGNASHNHTLAIGGVIPTQGVEPNPNVQLRYCKKG
jgi:hypothetical protein